MLKLLRCVLGPLALATAAFAPVPYDWADVQDYAHGEYLDSQALCRAVKTARIPAADMPDGATRATRKDCDSEALYYGIGRARDPVRARRCAIAEMDDPDLRDHPFAGAAMVMVIYANGVGARRDLDLAIHLACGLESAPAEHDLRVKSLAAMRSQARPAEFTFCDDVTSGYSGGFCAAHAQRFAVVRREAYFARVAKGWTPPQRQAFDRLHKAATAFIDARTANEVDLSGSLRGAFAIEEEEARWDAFRATLGQLVKGGAAGTPAVLAAADARLNAAYRRIQAASIEDNDRGTVNPKGVRDTERVWIGYRDAWLAFAKVVYPRASAAGLARTLTDERTRMLNEIVEPTAQ